MKGTLSCVFDDQFFFNYSDLTTEELEEGVIKVPPAPHGVYLL